MWYACEEEKGIVLCDESKDAVIRELRLREPLRRENRCYVTRNEEGSKFFLFSDEKKMQERFGWSDQMAQAVWEDIGNVELWSQATVSQRMAIFSVLQAMRPLASSIHEEDMTPSDWALQAALALNKDLSETVPKRLYDRMILTARSSFRQWKKRKK